MSDIEININENKTRATALIEITLSELYMQHRIKEYIGVLLSEAVKNIIRTKYHEIESMVVDEIFKKETRITIQNLIREKIEKDVEKYIESMFFGKEEK